jgi:hypothetical protein
VLQIAPILASRTDQKEFYRAGELIAFPSLEYLAIRANVAEKTAQRAIDDLEAAGLVQITPRFNNSNKHFLTIPADAEITILEQDEKERQRRERRQRERTHMARTDSLPSVPRGGQMGTKNGQNAPKCPPNLTTNLTCSLSYKGTDFSKSVLLQDPFSDFRKGKEKRLSEKVSGGEAELYRIARESFGGENGASVVAKALGKGGMSRADVWRTMCEEIDAGNTGDAQALAYALSPSWSDH